MKMTVKEFKQKIQSLIGENKTDEAIKAIENRFQEHNDEDLLNQIIVIKADYTELKKNETMDIISFDEGKRHRNKIHVNLLNLCSNIDDNTHSHEPETKAACKAAYALLMYLSENTNSKAVFFEDLHKNYFLRKPQGKEFIEKLPEMYLAEGHGMYLPKEVTEDLYIFRSKVYKIIDHATINGNEDDLIPVNNAGIKKLVTVLRNRLALNLKKNMG